MILSRTTLAIFLITACFVTAAPSKTDRSTAIKSTNHELSLTDRLSKKQERKSERKSRVDHSSHGRHIRPSMDMSMFDGETSDHESRMLKTPNNFVVYTEYNDSDCGSTKESFGYLVNYCYRRSDNSSFLYKVNKKEMTIVEIAYNHMQKACEGVPDAVYNVKNFIDEWQDGSMWGSCNSDGEYHSTLTYNSELPTFHINGVANYSYDAMWQCQRKKPTYFHFTPAGECFEDEEKDNVFYKVDTEGCGATGYYVISYFFNDACEGTPYTYAVDSASLSHCHSLYGREDGDAEHHYGNGVCVDDSGEDSNTFPTATCMVDYVNWVGDGICDSTGGYNTVECNWDNGDCCADSCRGTGCGNFDCQDPMYAIA